MPSQTSLCSTTGAPVGSQPDVAGAAAVTGYRRVEHVLPIIGILRRRDPAPISIRRCSTFER